MRLLESALPSGGGTLKLLKERAARQHPATLAERLNAQLKGAPEALDVHSDAAFAALVRADVMAIAKAGAMEPSLAADALGAAIEEGMLGQGILPTDRQALLAALDQLSIHRLYQKINLKVTPETSPAFTNVQVLEPPRASDQGAFTPFSGSVSRSWTVRCSMASSSPSRPRRRTIRRPQAPAFQRAIRRPRCATSRRSPMPENSAWT
ncbi:hypothetical protein [Acidovorax sp. SUPP2825]|uniref:hypothetical protein n=1 Tax=Acidovorax sp. SUPP2825 TaxID=2920879 RepID=UPI0023DE6106|nr:hypothetical protein [Acidovorax sp. SUPP2825]GKS94962.1 hypothetical protein AVAK2825_10525 [Acidovorax sp. SUPP2825]